MAKMGNFDMGYWLYMNEQSGSGLVKTRTGKINAIGKELRDQGYMGQIVPQSVFQSLLDKYKVTDITEHELRIIEERWL